MKQFITAARVRAIIAGAYSEKAITDALRAHRVRYSFSTTGGYFHIAVPARSGTIRIYRTACKNAPFSVHTAHRAPFWYLSRPADVNGPEGGKNGHFRGLVFPAPINQ